MRVVICLYKKENKFLLFVFMKRNRMKEEVDGGVQKG